VGEIGSGPLSYTAIGEQVGMAQRMESVAARAGVMLSESTARLVGDAVTLSEPEGVRIKGALVNADASHHPAGLALLNEYRDACIRGRRGGDAVRLSPSSRCRNSRRARYGRGR
jgi:hypothetical protein